jgi:hypothetical protein
MNEDGVAMLAPAGVPDIKERLAKGDGLGTNFTYRCCMDSLNQLDY